MSKYRAEATMRGPYRFDSAAEARYYDLLEHRQEAGEIRGFLRQVPFHFKCGVKLVVDYQVFFPDGTSEFVEVKGVWTKDFILKTKLFESEYGDWATLRIIDANDC
ncbi:MAG: DUF1064 domain-containing protein [Candidatus Sericytochromatia bacterium]